MNLKKRSLVLEHGNYSYNIPQTWYCSVFSQRNSKRSFGNSPAPVYLCRFKMAPDKQATWIPNLSSFCQWSSSYSEASIPMRPDSIHTSEWHTLHPDCDVRYQLLNPPHFMRYRTLRLTTPPSVETHMKAGAVAWVIGFSQTMSWQDWKISYKKYVWVTHIAVVLIISVTWAACCSSNNSLSAGGWGIRGGFRLYPPVLNQSLLAQSAVQPRPPLTRAHNDSVNQRLAITTTAH